jgi:uncharacterized protein
MPSRATMTNTSMADRHGSKVFVDTSAWYALADARTSDHVSIKAVLKAHRLSLVTSDYIFDEIVTLIRMRRGFDPARRFGEELLSGRVATIVRLLPVDLDAAWAVFCRRHDQRLSFTDCTSFALMQRLKIETAIALDDDFRALGFMNLP